MAYPHPGGVPMPYMPPYPHATHPQSQLLSQPVAAFHTAVHPQHRAHPQQQMVHMQQQQALYEQQQRDAMLKAQQAQKEQQEKEDRERDAAKETEGRGDDEENGQKGGPDEMTSVADGERRRVGGEGASQPPGDGTIAPSQLSVPAATGIAPSNGSALPSSTPTQPHPPNPALGAGGANSNPTASNTALAAAAIMGDGDSSPDGSKKRKGPAKAKNGTANKKRKLDPSTGPPGSSLTAPPAIAPAGSMPPAAAMSAMAGMYAPPAGGNPYAIPAYYYDPSQMYAPPPPPQAPMSVPPMQPGQHPPPHPAGKEGITGGKDVPKAVEEFRKKAIKACTTFYDAANDLIAHTAPHVLLHAFPTNGPTALQVLDEMRRACDQFLSLSSGTLPAPSTTPAVPSLSSSTSAIPRPSIPPPGATASSDVVPLTSRSKPRTEYKSWATAQAEAGKEVTSDPTSARPGGPQLAWDRSRTAALGAPNSGVDSATVSPTQTQIGRPSSTPKQTPTMASVTSAGTTSTAVSVPTGATAAALANTLIGAVNAAAAGTGATQSPKQGGGGAWTADEVAHLKALVEAAQAALTAPGTEPQVPAQPMEMPGESWDWVVSQLGPSRTRHQVINKATNLGLRKAKSIGGAGGEPGAAPKRKRDRKAERERAKARAAAAAAAAAAEAAAAAGGNEDAQQEDDSSDLGLEDQEDDSDQAVRQMQAPMPLSHHMGTTQIDILQPNSQSQTPTQLHAQHVAQPQSQPAQPQRQQTQQSDYAANVSGYGEYRPSSGHEYRQVQQSAQEYRPASGQDYRATARSGTTQSTSQSEYRPGTQTTSSDYSAFSHTQPQGQGMHSSPMTTSLHASPLSAHASQPQQAQPLAGNQQRLPALQTNGKSASLPHLRDIRDFAPDLRLPTPSSSQAQMHSQPQSQPRSQGHTPAPVAQQVGLHQQAHRQQHQQHTGHHVQQQQQQVHQAHTQAARTQPQQPHQQHGQQPAQHQQQPQQYQQYQYGSVASSIAPNQSGDVELVPRYSSYYHGYQQYPDSQGR